MVSVAHFPHIIFMNTRTPNDVTPALSLSFHLRDRMSSRGDGQHLHRHTTTQVIWNG